MTESDDIKPILDHIVVLVSYKTLQELPKRLENDLIVIDGGAHADGRTVNKLIEFPDGVYIELIAFQDGLDPEKRRSHRWGNLEENTVIDWAYTLPHEKNFDVIQERVKRSNSDVVYHNPVPGGRLRPDGVELKWSVASAYAVAGRALYPGKAPFWCLDRTLRRLRVPYKEEDGSQPDYTKHPSGVIGVSSVSIAVPQREQETLTKVYNGIHDFTARDGTWPFIVYSGSKAGKHRVELKKGQDDGRKLHLTLLGKHGSPSSIEILPGLAFSVDSGH